MPDQFIENNVEFERKWHWFERIVWITLIGLLVVICLGYLGRGPQARQTAAASDGSLRIAYDRVLRSHSQSDIEFVVQRGSDAGSQVQIRLAGALLDTVPYLQMIPEPAASRPGHESSTYTFDGEADRATRVRLVQKTSAPGRFRSVASVPGHPDVVIEQIVLP